MPPSPATHEAQWFIDILNAMTELVLVKGERSKLLWANRAFLEYYGMSNAQLQELIDAPHSDPDDTVQYVRDDHEVITTGKVLDIAAEPVTDAGGTTRYFHTVKSPIFGPDNRIERTVGVSRPVTDAERLNASVDRRRTRKAQLNELRALVLNLPTAMAMLDVKRRILCHSPAWRALCGQHEALEGLFVDAVFAAAAVLDQPLTAAIEHGRPTRQAAVDLVLGAKMVVEIITQPWYLPDGTVGGAIVLVHDITPIKTAERRLQQANDELMQFNYRVSHDLVAPLRTIRGYLELSDAELADGNISEARALHRRMVDNVDRLSQLVRDVFDLARADTQTAAPRPIDLRALTEAILDQHRAALDAESIVVKVDYGVGVFYSELIRLQQVLDNLISNAINYHDPAKTQRRIALRFAARGQALVITVSDNGIGIDEALGDTVFDMFVRGTGNHPGSGIGLYLVRKHVEYLGGTVQLCSPRNDTVFQVTLPVTTGESIENRQVDYDHRR